MITAQCLAVEYEGGRCFISQGIKGGSKIKSIGNGYTQFPQNGGWAKNIKPSKLILIIKVNGKIYSTWIDRYFKDEFKRLTEKRRTIIEQTMPETVEVEEFRKKDGSEYFVVTEKSLKKWLIRTNL